MSRRAVLLFLATAAAALLLFAFVLRQMSLVSMGLASNAEVQEVLRQSLENQKRLAHADPRNAATYHRRFDETQTLLAHLQILELTRARLIRNYEAVMVGIVAMILLAGGVVVFMERRVRDRRRARYLEHLKSWQEAARRHAHEIRTPLTAASLEIGQLVSTMAKRHPEESDALGDAERSIREELEHLRRFTTAFASFATLGEPQLVPHDLCRFTQEFCAMFAETWPDLRIVCERGEGNCMVMMDREMIRQVFVNLCTNAAHAAEEIRIRARATSSTVIVEFRDDGPGVPSEIRSRLFEPYTTTRKLGEGMGLGLAISKKIMLDHGGDLVLVDAPRGAVFRVTLPAREGARS